MALHRASCFPAGDAELARSARLSSAALDIIPFDHERFAQARIQYLSG